VDEFAGPGAFVAADGFAGGPFRRGQGGQTVPVQDPVGGGGGDTGAGRQPQRADAVLASQPHDLFLHPGRRPVRLAVRAAGAVLHAGLALLPVAACPACGGGVADLEAFRSPP
jgi:hypothetical protein